MPLFLPWLPRIFVRFCAEKPCSLLSDPSPANILLSSSATLGALSNPVGGSSLFSSQSTGATCSNDYSLSVGKYYRLQGRSAAGVYIRWKTQAAVPRDVLAITAPPFWATVVLDPEGSPTESAVLSHEAEIAFLWTNMKAKVAFSPGAIALDPQGGCTQ